MEEIYKKILNGEININYLSPIDLINLEIYLESIHINLNELIKNEKNKNEQLENIKQEIQSSIEDEVQS